MINALTACSEEKPSMLSHIIKGAITTLLAILSFFLITTFSDLRETMKSVNALSTDVSIIRLEVGHLVKSVDKIEQSLDEQNSLLVALGEKK